MPPASLLLPADLHSALAPDTGAVELTPRHATSTSTATLLFHQYHQCVWAFLNAVVPAHLAADIAAAAAVLVVDVLLQPVLLLLLIMSVLRPTPAILHPEVVSFPRSIVTLLRLMM